MREAATKSHSCNSIGRTSVDSRRAARLFRYLRKGTAVGTAAAVFSLGAGVLGVAPAWAAKKPVIPSQSQVDQANAATQAKAVQIGQTEAELAAANAMLDKLNGQVELAVEKYDGAAAKLQAAQGVAAQAEAALATARGATAAARVQLGMIAAESYRAGADLGRLTAMMTSDSPGHFLTRAATLAAIDRHQQGIVAQMSAAERQQDAAQRAADQAVSAQKSASDAAAKAKDAAVAAMNNQAGQVQQIQGSQSQLQAQLAVLKGTAQNLAAARAQGLKQQAEEAAAAAAAAAAAKKKAEQLASQHPGSGGSSSGGSTGSGSTGTDGGGVTPGTGHSVSTAAQRATAIAYAQAQIGVWYRWAGTGEVGPTVTSSGVQNVPGFDCSGLTMRAYEAAGISLGHYTGLQWDEGMHVSRDQLVPGDLVFFATDLNDPSTIHHVGIYIGNGQMIDAPRTGEQIGVHNAFRSDYIGAVQP